MDHVPKIASAPGKVLMTGGYLILERPNAGIVLSTNARFYAIVKPLYEEIKPESWAWAWTDVKLTSPQMSRETIYKLSLKHLTLQPVSSSSASRNPFVEHAVQYAVAAAHAKFGKDKTDALQKILLQGLDITILGCNEFYSYRNQVFHVSCHVSSSRDSLVVFSDHFLLVPLNTMAVSKLVVDLNHIYAPKSNLLVVRVPGFIIIKAYSV
nr:phosphomevalonate kinase, peroxisomal-like [Coffea arabica]